MPYRTGKAGAKKVDCRAGKNGLAVGGLGLPMPVLTSRQNGVCLSVLLSSPKEVEVIT
jgi:hypothetical protein